MKREKMILKKGKSKVGNGSLVKSIKLKKWMALFMICYMCLPMTVAYASASGGTAEDKWNQVMNFFIPWIERFGGAVILFGVALFGEAWIHDRPDSFSNGLKIILGGAIIYAAGKFAPSLLA